LRQLLAAEEGAGQLTIEENGPRTLITLVAPELFAPASVALDPHYRALLHAIGAAADQVPGRLLVEGHTDDQPLRSFAYRDNYELSRERAATVAKILRADLQNAARLEIVGKGSSEPRYRPESTTENRARNRRVEIIHVRE
jgi:type VI secretion system protein ImpK